MYVVQATEKWCSCLTEDTTVVITKLSPSCSCSVFSVSDRWVKELLCTIGGIVLSAESRSTERKTCHSANLSTTNITRTLLGTNLGLRDERPATDRQTHGTTCAGGSHSGTRCLNMLTLCKMQSFCFFKWVVGIGTAVE